MKDKLTLDILKLAFADIPNIHFGTQHVPESEDILFAAIPVDNTAILKALNLLMEYPVATILNSSEGITLYFTEGTEPFDVPFIDSWEWCKTGTNLLRDYEAGIKEGMVFAEPFGYCFSKGAKEHLARRYVLIARNRQIYASIGFIDPDKSLSSFILRTLDEVYCELRYKGVQLVESELTIKGYNKPIINLVRFLNAVIEYWYDASENPDVFIRQLNSKFIKLSKDET